MSQVTLEGIRKSFGARSVLKGCDLDVANGEIMAVLGPSGCGKTTMLRIVAGFLDPDAGTLSFDGTPVAGPRQSVSPQRRQVGYVPQEGALFPHLNVRANILFGLPRKERTESRFREMLDLADLSPDVGSAYPHELSGGQQQRVALARALAPRPRVVLLDEPCSSLDASLRVSTGRAVARVLRAAGTTAILVTHDQGEALSLADRVAVMRDGRIVQVSEPVELYRRPVDVEVATSVGGIVALPALVGGGCARCVLGELQVKAGPHHDNAVTVLVRPEQIRLVEAAPGRLEAHVAAVDFFGPYATVRLRVRAGAGDDIEVVARVPGNELPQVGELVGVCVDGCVEVST